MLASQLHDVAAPETGKEQQCERQSFPRADRPACLKAFDFRIRPAVEALGFRTKAACPFRWIALDVAKFKSPAEQSAHAFQKSIAAKGVSLRRSIAAAIVLRVILANGSSPAVSMTWRKMFSRWRLVAPESRAQAPESR